jgi:YdjC-like protein
MSGKYIIFVSDDFGMTHSVNSGIVKAMTEGVVTASNFMVPTPWFSESLSLARKLNLPVGIHLNITCEWDNYRWRPLTGPSSICDSDGTFFKSYKELMENAEIADIYNEYKAQIEYLKSLNWNITHIDTHMLPPVFNCGSDEKKVAVVVEKIAEDFGLIYLYGCKDGKSRYFDTYYEKSGRSENELYEHLSGLGDGFHLIVTHSAMESDEQQNIATDGSIPFRWALEYRKADMATLTSDKLKKFLDKNEFEKITVPRLLELKNINFD